MKAYPLLLAASLSLAGCAGPAMDTACFFNIWKAAAENKATVAEHQAAIIDARRDCDARYAAGR